MDRQASILYRSMWTDDEKAFLCEWYGKLRVAEIAERLGRTVNGVVEQARSRRMGLRSAGKNRFMSESKVHYPYDRRFFAAVTEESAYWAGFLAADGCLHPRRQTVQIILNAVDRSHLE